MNFFDQNSAPAISGNLANHAFRGPNPNLTTVGKIGIATYFLPSQVERESGFKHNISKHMATLTCLNGQNLE